mgnify:CR=1 FL=1
MLFRSALESWSTRPEIVGPLIRLRAISGHDDGGFRCSRLDAPYYMKWATAAISLQHQERGTFVEVRVVFDNLAVSYAAENVREQDAARANPAGGMVRNDDISRGGQLPDAICNSRHQRILREDDPSLAF